MAKSTVFWDAIQALEQLERAEGPLAREAILGAQRDNPALRAIIKMAVGPDRYFMRPSPNVVSTSQLDPVASWRAFRKLTAQLKNRELTGNEAKRDTQRFLASCRPLLTKWYCRILNRDLRCGVGLETVAKVFGDGFLLADSAQGAGWKYNGCALARDYAEVYKVTARRGEVKPKFPLAVESKYDGERFNSICFPRDNSIFVLTRSGKRRQPIEQVEAFRDQVLGFCSKLNEGVNPNRPLFLDGEFLARKWNDTSSIVRKTKNFDAELFLREVRVILWDWSPIDQYLAGRFDMKWLRRKAELLRCTGAVRPGDKLCRFARNVWAAGHTLVYDQEQLDQAYEFRLDAGYEGVVLKDIEAPHYFKRTKYLVKLKPEDNVTARIVDLVAGEGQHSAVASAVKRKVLRLLQQHGETVETDLYLHCKTKESKQLRKIMRQELGGDNEYRLSIHKPGCLSYRHGERLGYLVVELENGDQLHVGGGFTHKAGQDQRAEFWRKRDELVGMKIDFKQQAGTTADTVSRFPRFVRLREDI